MMVAQPFNIYDITPDPTKGLPGMPPAFGRYTIPHGLMFSGLLSSVSRVYRASDEALKDSFENAKLMRNDPVVEECIEIRRQACCLFDWHLEPGNKNDAAQLEACRVLTKMIESIRRFIQYRENLLHATWYGKSAIEHKWGWKRIGGSMRLMPVEWVPIHGDKIVFRYDDGRGDYRPDQIGIRVGFPARQWRKEFEKWRKKTAYWENDPLLKRIHEHFATSKQDKIQPTDYGLAYFLDSWERPLLAIHKHQIEDGEYEEPTNAGRLHGKGIRSVIYWAWMQKQAALSLLMEYLERSAFGFNVAYYPAHNEQAANEIKDAVLRQSESGGSRNLIFFPVWQDEQAQNYRIDHIEPGIGGVESLKMIIQDYFGHLIKRYILGQTLTSEAGSTGLGSDLARVHLGTFMQKVRYDAKLKEETLTTDLLDLLIQYNFPELSHAGIRFVIDTESEDAQEKLEAFKMAHEMGLKLRAQDVRDVIGASKPEADDEVLDMAEMQKAMQPAMPYGMPMGANGEVTGHTPDTTPLEQESYTPGMTVATDRTPMIRTNDERPKGSDKAVVADLTRQLAAEFGRRGSKTVSYAAFKEDEHPRDDDGKWTFSEGGGQARAKRGGEYGPNGEWYKGGAWIATTDLPKRERDKLAKMGKGRVRTGAGEWDTPPPGKIAIFDRLAGAELNPRTGDINEQYLTHINADEEYVSAVEELAKRFSNGEKWVDVVEFPEMAHFKHVAGMLAAGQTIPGHVKEKIPEEWKGRLYLKKLEGTQQAK